MAKKFITGGSNKHFFHTKNEYTNECIIFGNYFKCEIHANKFEFYLMKSFGIIDVANDFLGYFSIYLEQLFRTNSFATQYFNADSFSIGKSPQRLV